MQRKVVIQIAVIVAIACAGAVATGQAAPHSGSRTLTLLERAEKVKLIDNPPKMKSSTSAPGFGDGLAFNARLSSAAGKTVGHLFGSGVFADSAARAVITGVYALHGGNLDLVVSATPGYKQAVGAIVGGTGTYAGARGTVTSVALPNGDFKDTITLLT